MSFVIQKDVPLAEFTTLKIGGAARFFVRARDESEVVEAIEFAGKNDLNVLILGGGSNVLIADRGFDGLVLQIALKGISLSKQTKEIVSAVTQAGEDWDEFVRFAVEENLQGVECLSGIPGFVGGTPVQNVGAYGQEVSETIASVRCFDRETKKIVELTDAECRFAYRASIFNTAAKNRYVVLAVTYNLKLDGAPKIVYRDLQNYFGAKQPTLGETRAAVLEIRRAKSMVIDENDKNSQSAGSFFKNPIVSLEKFAEIERAAARQKIQNVPKFVVDGQSVKIPAAWLIENAGFQKGYRKGKVGISTRHTLAIVNLGGATARDVLALKHEIEAEVEKKFDVLLKPEPVFVNL